MVLMIMTVECKHLHHFTYVITVSTYASVECKFVWHMMYRNVISEVLSNGDGLLIAEFVFKL